MKAMRRLVCDSDTSTRAGALRALRYAISSSTSIKHLVDLNLPVFVVRSLEREQKHLAERVQALKVVRRILEIDAAQMPTGLVCSLTAIAGHKDDNMRRVCLETLRELALLNVEVVAEANGTKILVDAILEPSFQDLADSLLMTLLLILNEPSTRKFIEPFVDSQVLLAPFTDTDLPAGNERRQRWMASRNAIVTMMRSWTGMVVLTSNPQGLQSLIQLLVRPVGEDVQKAVLSTICEIFYKKTSFDRSAADAAADTPVLPVSLSSAEQLPLAVNHNLLDNYTVIILLAMIHCGILEALVTLGTGPSRALADPAIDLLADILRMASRLLPDQHCASLLALPRLVSSTSLTTTTTMSLGDHAKSLLERLQREKSIRASEMLGELANAVGANSGSIATRGVSLTSRELMVLELKQSLDAQMDDSTFKDMLHNRSRVLTDKNYKNWNWDIISEMLEGPLTNPQRLSEAMKTKFFKRLSGFFRCDQGNKGYFSNLYWIPDHVPYLRPACQMYTLLLNHPEGLLFLKTDRRGQLLTEISSALELEARPEAAIVESHIGVLKARMFSPDYVSRRMLREYFTLLGLMSSSKEGLKMMEQSNLFQRLYVMGTTKGHDFLCRLILANLDYSVDGSSRKLLQSWMMEGSKALRLYATCLLRALLRSEVADFDKWGIDALVTQLTQEEEVAKAALSVLEEAAETPACLLAMILKRPMKLIQLKDKRAESLLLRSLSLAEGLNFLRDTGDWIPRTLAAWLEMDSAAGTNTSNGSVKRLLLKSVEFTLQLLPLRPRTVPLPVHLYGELAKTSAGCQILHSSGHLPEFLACLRDAASVPLEKRAALWALGHVSATPRGYDLLNHYAQDFVDMIVKLATDSPLVSIRGTCFFVLGLLARSPAGRRHLARLGWDAPRDASRTSIAVPQNCTSLFMWPPSGSSTPCPLTQTPGASPLQRLLIRRRDKMPNEWREVLRFVADLSNHITQKEAHASLNKLRSSKPELFEEPVLLMYVHALLEKYSYRLALRQFVLNAFDRATLTDEV
eukprot:jgi/Phyca11/559789/estExt2_Genewise1.C_PHYCAscaffold_40097